MTEESNTGSNIVLKAASTETGKVVTSFFFEKLENLSRSFSKTREIQEILHKLNINDEAKSNLATKFRDEFLTTRTILRPGVNVDIQDRYHPLALLEESTGNKFAVSDNTELPYRRVNCIVGKAGQGKTTLLKKLLLNTLEKGTKFPIFIILRHVDWTTASVTSIISKELNKLGFDIDEDTCSYLLQSEKAIIFWDGFDEIPQENRNNAASIIIEAWNRYNCPGIVSTRPETEITVYGGAVKNYILQDLKIEDAQSIIELAVKNDDEYKENLLSAVQKNETLSNILITPIIVDIFIYTYRSLKSEPKSISDFYAQIFECIASQHDRLKMLRRGTKSELSIGQLENVMHLASYILLTKFNTTFKISSIRAAFSSACEKLKIQDHKNLSHQDVIEISNLIISDGDGCYSYIHKSILEYYAAAFISSASESSQATFYSKANAHFSRFVKTLEFLLEIDSNNFYRFYAQPILNEYPDLSSKPTDALLALSGFTEILFRSYSNGALGEVSYKTDKSDLFKLVEVSRNDDLHELRSELAELIHDFLAINVSEIPSEFLSCKQESDTVNNIDENLYTIDARGLIEFLNKQGKGFYMSIPMITSSDVSDIFTILQELQMHAVRIIKELEGDMTLALEKESAVDELIAFL